MMNIASCVESTRTCTYAQYAKNPLDRTSDGDAGMMLPIDLKQIRDGGCQRDKRCFAVKACTQAPIPRPTYRK